jgi:hypothetical protein
MNQNMSKGIWLTIGIMIVVVGLSIWSYHVSHPVSQVSVQVVADPTGLPGIQTTDAPWSVELTNLRARLAAIGLPALAQEGTALHIHQHLDIFINGQTVAVPAGIGINEIAQFISPIHVHDDSGIIHVESPVVQTFTLGQFFDIWGVRFTNQCIGSYCTNEAASLKVYVNGELYQGDPRVIALASHQEIAVVYGTPAQNPHTIPSSYSFPAGY